ncbi:MAG TPA: threonine/serine dehydratase [Chloroflexota bacterium]|nr:threonine/serine dehydratase [Chloroflexota bacterium]
MSITQADIHAARALIGNRLHRTPTLSATSLGRMAGVRLLVKAELLQKTGSFKPRGVLARLAALTAEERERGVIGISAGNHAQALAYGAALEGIGCTVVMPATAVASKVAAARAYGARVVQHGASSIEAFEEYERLLATEGQVPVHPFSDPRVIAGQGTIGLELLEEVPDLEAVIVPVGGGGLLAGVAVAIKEQRPHVRIVGVEPEGAPGLSRALASGQVQALTAVQTIADGLAAPFASQITLQIAQRYVDDVVLVSDQQIAEALGLVLERTKLQVEPAGAAGVAALLARRCGLPDGACTVAILSGGNIDRALLKALV